MAADISRPQRSIANAAPVGATAGRHPAGPLTAKPAPDPFLVAVGQLARSARKQLGLTQNDVAKRAGLHSASVYAIEGATANPTLHNLRLLASALEIDVADLFPRRGAAELALPAVQASEFAERISRLEEQVAGLAQRLDATAGPRRRKPGSKL